MKTASGTDGGRYPGNRRQRAAQLEYIDGGERIVAPMSDRDAIKGALPVWSLASGLGRDEAFLKGLEAALDGGQPVDAIVARYQRRKSYGYRVVECFAERAVQRVVERLLTNEQSPSEIRQGLRSGIAASSLDVFHHSLEIEDGIGRWRAPAGRERAVAALLALGAGRCLVDGCNEPANQRYCTEHAKSERRQESTPQTKGEEDVIKASHDLLVASVADLLGEVGTLLAIA